MNLTWLFMTTELYEETKFWIIAYDPEFKDVFYYMKSNKSDLDKLQNNVTLKKLQNWYILDQLYEIQVAKKWSSFKDMWEKNRDLFIEWEIPLEIENQFFLEELPI